MLNKHWTSWATFPANSGFDKVKWSLKQTWKSLILTVLSKDNNGNQKAQAEYGGYSRH